VNFGCRHGERIFGGRPAAVALPIRVFVLVGAWFWAVGTRNSWASPTSVAAPEKFRPVNQAHVFYGINWSMRSPKKNNWLMTHWPCNMLLDSEYPALIIPRCLLVLIAMYSILNFWLLHDPLTLYPGVCTRSFAGLWIRQAVPVRAPPLYHWTSAIALARFQLKSAELPYRPVLDSHRS
jgi:hypothetical protein